MQIFVVRHGETDWNVEEKLQGRVDIELNSNGIEQANSLRNEIIDKNYNIDLIISSPLKRTKKTAEIISEGKIPIIYNEKIIERAFGELEGIKFREDERFIKNNIFDLNSKSEYEGVETLDELCSRTFEFLDEVKEKYKDKNIMLVTHGGTIRAINAYFNGIPENRNNKFYKNKEL